MTLEPSDQNLKWVVAISVTALTLAIVFRRRFGPVWPQVKERLGPRWPLLVKIGQLATLALVLLVWAWSSLD